MNLDIQNFVLNFVLGLSNKINKEPFDKSTISGKIINNIIDNLDDECYKINLISYAPLDNDKLRYPTKLEIKEEIPKFLNTIKKINPDLIIGFGSIVGEHLSKMEDINKKLIIEKHPSYIYVYKRKEIDSYIKKIINKIKEYKVI